MTVILDNKMPNNMPNDMNAQQTDDNMKDFTTSPIVHLTSRAISPFIMLVGLYVFFHGHYSPGGGFQGGVMMGASILLLRLSLGVTQSQVILPTWLTLRLSAIGALLYVGTGIVPVFFDGNILEYGFLPISGMKLEYLRYYGILFIELGVTLAVMTTLVSIYDDLLGY
jgi:multicomponent Na+:H+ antiporter subunit B